VILSAEVLPGKYLVTALTGLIALVYNVRKWRFFSVRIFLSYSPPYCLCYPRSGCSVPEEELPCHDTF
jgi:hypothetical protein